MFVSMRAPALLTLLTAFLAAPSVQAISKIARTGRYLYNETNHRFYIKGVAYQEQGAVIASDDNPFGEPSTFIDPLALDSACKRDLPLLQQLSVNVIRVYSVNSSLNHDACMKLFSQNGIYAIIDLALPLNGSIDRVSPSWSTNILNQYTETIDTFSKYDNVLAFNVGNEVVLQDSTQIAPYVKAAARDIKAYLQSKSSSVLVGYSAINGASDWRGELANFLSCDPSGSNSGSTAIDLYGLNDYEWCGDSNFQSSYSGTTEAFADYNVVAYFSEFGCITKPPRLWTETESLFGTDMNTVWSGGIAFSYFPASSVQGQFGMVTVSSDGSSVTTSDDFTKLATEYGKVQFIDSPAQSSAVASSYPSCAAPSTSFLASNTLPQTPNEASCDCVEAALGCRFTPKSSNTTAIVGELLDTSCSLLGQSKGSCEPVGGNGQTGVYGSLSACDPTIKLSFVMSSYYELQGRTQADCSFSGNGTVNAAASTASATAVVSSCIANPTAVFTPSSAPTSGSGSGGSTNTGKSATGTGSSSGSSAISLIHDTNALFRMGVMAMVSVLGAIFTLA